MRARAHRSQVCSARAEVMDRNASSSVACWSSCWASSRPPCSARISARWTRAHAGEPVDGLPFAPPVGGLSPLAGPPVVRGVPARGDHRAVGHPGGDGAELAVHRGDGRLLHQPEPFLGPPQRDQERSVAQQPEGLEVRVPEAGADLDGPSRHFEGAVDVSGHLRPVALREGQVAVGEALWLPFEEALPAGGPGRCDGALLLERVLAADVECERGGAGPVASVLVGLERPLLRLDGQVGLRGEPRRQRQGLEVGGTELRFPVGLGQQVERGLPPVLSQCLVGRGQAGRTLALSRFHPPNCPTLGQWAAGATGSGRRRPAPIPGRWRTTTRGRRSSASRDIAWEPSRRPWPAFGALRPPRRTAGRAGSPCWKPTSGDSTGWPMPWDMPTPSACWPPCSITPSSPSPPSAPEPSPRPARAPDR